MAARDNGPMTAPAMIELDDLGAEPPAGRPYPAWPRWRAVVAGALVLLCLAVLSGAHAAEPGLSRPLWTVTPGTTDGVPTSSRSRRYCPGYGISSGPMSKTSCLPGRSSSATARSSTVWSCSNKEA